MYPDADLLICYAQSYSYMCVCIELIMFRVWTSSDINYYHVTITLRYSQMSLEPPGPIPSMFHLTDENVYAGFTPLRVTAFTRKGYCLRRRNLPMQTCSLTG